MPSGVYPRTLEHNRRVSEALKGRAHTSPAQIAADIARNAGRRGKPAWNSGLVGVQVAWNKGLTCETDERVARYCEKTIPILNRHRPKVVWNRGLTKDTDERLARMSAKRRAHVANCYGCGSPACGGNSYPSKLAWRAYELLLMEFEVVIPEERFGTYRIDFLLAEEWLAIEIDGPFHDVEFDQRRDAWLLENFELPVVRLSQEDIERLTRGKERRKRRIWPVPLSNGK